MCAAPYGYYRRPCDGDAYCNHSPPVPLSFHSFSDDQHHWSAGMADLRGRAVRSELLHDGSRHDPPRISSRVSLRH